MQFLVITRDKDSLYTLPPQTKAEVETGTIAVIDRYLKEGKCKAFYEGVDNCMSPATLRQIGLREYPTL